MMNEEQRFEADLRAALAPEPASGELRRRILAEVQLQGAQRGNRSGSAGNARPGWLSRLDPQGWFGSWRLVEFGALAAAASLAFGIFAGASGFVPDGTMLGGTATVAASDGDGTVDLVALAYDSSGVTGDFQ